MNPADILVQMAKEQPDRAALTERGRGWTYAQLRWRAECAALALRDLGMGPGGRCCVLCTSRRLALELYFACALLGGVFVPLSPEEEREALHRWFRVLKPEVILFDRTASRTMEQLAQRDRLPKGCAARSLDGRGWTGQKLEWPESAAAALAPEDVSPENEHLILLTAGRSGAPKAAVLTAGGVMDAVRAHEGEMCGAIVQVTQPMHTLTGVLETLRAIRDGAALAAAPVRNAADWFAAAEEYAVEVSFVTAPLLREIVYQAPQNIPRPKALRRLCYGGELVSADMIGRAVCRFPDVELRQFYGVTECAEDRLLVWDASDPGQGARLCQGVLGWPGRRSVSLRRVEQGAALENRLDEIVVPLGGEITGWYDAEGNFFPWRGGLFRTEDLAQRGEDGCFRFSGHVYREDQGGKRMPALIVFPNIYIPEEYEDYGALHRQLPEQFLQLVVFFQKLGRCTSPETMVQCFFQEIPALIPADAYYMRFIKDYRGFLHLENEKNGPQLAWGNPQHRRMTEFSMRGGEVRRNEDVLPAGKRVRALPGMQGTRQVIAVPFYSETLAEIGMLAIGRKNAIDDMEIRLIQSIAKSVLQTLIGFVETQKKEQDLLSSELALESIANAVLVSDGEGRIHYLNARAKELFFHPEYESLRPLVTAALQDSLARIRQTGMQQKNGVIHYFTPDGVQRALALKSTLTEDGTKIVSTITRPDRRPEMQRLKKRLDGRPRTMQFVTLLLQGMSNAEIGAAMSVTNDTVQYYLRVLYREFEVHRRSDLISALYALAYRYE